MRISEDGLQASHPRVLPEPFPGDPGVLRSTFNRHGSAYRFPVFHEEGRVSGRGVPLAGGRVVPKEKDTRQIMPGFCSEKMPFR